MHHRAPMLLAAIVVAAMAARGAGREPDERTPLPEGLILIGVKTDRDPKVMTIEVMSPAGAKLRTLFRSEQGLILSARAAPTGDRIAFSFKSPDGKAELRIINGGGETDQVADIADDYATITSWSPDGKQVAFYRPAPDGRSHESFMIDLATQEIAKVELPADYVAEDWHPVKNVRTAIYMNPRNLLYRPQKGDHYPTRQLDLVAADGQRTPITKNPSTDNIWARFSPDGQRLAHYGRRLTGEKSLEYAVVCDADGSQPKEFFQFTQFGDAAGLPWLRPNGPPAWSPDNSTLAWLVSTNSEPKSVGAKLEVLLTPVDGGPPTRISLTDNGYTWVTAVEWR